MLFQEVVVPYVGFIDFKGIFLKEGSVPDRVVSNQLPVHPDSRLESF